MEAASERLDFETAALLRDQIMAIDRVAAGQKVVMESDTEMDVIALAGRPMRSAPPCCATATDA